MTSNEDCVLVACAADERYVMPLAVMLASLSDTIDPSRRCSVYVLDSGLSPEDRERLGRSIQGDTVDLHWVDVRSARLSDLPLWGRMSASTYHRLMVAELLPTSVERVLWLDCDLVVNADLGTLWTSHLDGRHVLAVQDMIVPFVSSREGVARYGDLGLAPDAKYFNAGVMVVNLDLWRRDDVPGRVITYLRSYSREVAYWDQEGLNAVLAGHWDELDPRWNQNAAVCGRGFYRPRHLDPETYRRVVEDPWIIHFSGNLKPWLLHDTTDPARALYFHYLDRTPWAGWRPPKTPWSSLVGRYETSRLRVMIYPAEKLGFEALRKWRVRRRPTPPPELPA